MYYIKCMQHYGFTLASEMCTLYELLFIMIFMNISESKRIKNPYERKLKRGTFTLFVLIPCPVVKAARGSTTLATKTLASPLVGG